MFKYKRLLSLFLSFLIFILNFNFSFSFAAEDELALTATNAIAIESKTGNVLFGKNEYQKVYPASTTKVWTAYLTIKQVENLDEIIEVKNDVSWVEPSSMFLKVGEKFTVRQLLEVLMLKSANDVAVVLAQYVSGSVEEFAKLMNEEAKKIGCENTNFVNPNGLPDENHYSTPYDMALIAKEALKSDILREIAGTEYISVPGNDVHPESRAYKNTNKFLTGGTNILYKGELIDSKYNIVEGLKTGYTSAAGRCLLSNAVVDDTEVIVGVFNSKGDEVYVDSRTIIDYALEKYKTLIVIDKDNFKASRNIGFSNKKVEGYIEEDYATVEDKELNSTNNEYDYNVTFDKKVELPIKKDSVIGEVEIKENGKKIDSVPLLATEDIEKSSLLPFRIIVILTLATLASIFIKLSKNIVRNNQNRKMKKIANTMYRRR